MVKDPGVLIAIELPEKGTPKKKYEYHEEAKDPWNYFVADDDQRQDQVKLQFDFNRPAYRHHKGMCIRINEVI